MTRFAPGAVLGGFRIEGVLGEGGMGVVYRATQLSLGRPVALKVLHVDLATASDARRRFVQEGRVAARVQHPRIVRVIEVGEDNGRLFLACELIEGPTLRQKLDRDGRLSPKEAVAAAAACAEALSSLHKEGILHRDLKPENLFLSPVSGLLVGDLGIAKDLLGGGIRTQQGILLGTPAYMAPELARGAPASPASDLYALGVVLFECLLGRQPFESEDPLELLTLHANASLPDVGNLMPELPAEYGALLAKALAKDPAARYGSAQELKQALEALPGATARAAAGKRVQSKAATMRLGSAVARPRADGTRVVTAAPAPANTRSLALVGILGGLLMIGAVGLLRHPAEPPPPGPKPARTEGMDLNAYREPLKAAVLSGERAVRESQYYQARLCAKPLNVDRALAAATVAGYFDGVSPAIVAGMEAASAAHSAGSTSAAADCGAMLSGVLDELVLHRTALAQIFFCQDAAPGNTRGWRNSLVGNDGTLHDFSSRASKTAAKLLERIPEPLRECGEPRWKVGVICLRSASRYAIDPRRAKDERALLLDDASRAWSAMALDRPPRPGEIFAVIAISGALGYAGEDRKREELLTGTVLAYRRLGKLAPGRQLLLQKILTENGERIISQTKLDFESGDTSVRQFNLAVEARNRLLSIWPYDLRKPIPPNPTREQAEAAEYDYQARGMLDGDRRTLDALALKVNKPVPPEP